MRRARWLSSIAIVGALAAVALRVGAAEETTQVKEDTLSALLTEVRGLREAMEQLASAGPRVQLALGRLQLQEQRVNTLARRADSVRDAIASVQKEALPLQERLARFQAALDRNARPEERADIEAQVMSDKQHLARAMAEIQRLQAEEADVGSQVAAEQARWIDINQRLEELERALTRR